MALNLRFRNENVAEKIRLMVEDAMDLGPYVPGQLAAELVAKLREEDPALLADWLDHHADQLMRETVLAVARLHRSAAVRRSNRSVFRSAVERAEAGYPDLLEGWLTQQFIAGPSLIRKRLGDMVKEEVMYASEVHAGLARGNQMQAAFLKAVADVLGARMVSEVYDNDQLDAMWRSLQ